MPFKREITEDTLDQFLKLLLGGCGTTKIAKELGISSSTVERWRLVYKMHGRDILYRYAIERYRLKYDSMGLARIIEYILANNLTSERASYIFLTSANKLNLLLKQRASLGRPLVDGAYPAEVPENVNLDTKEPVKVEHYINDDRWCHNPFRTHAMREQAKLQEAQAAQAV